MTSKKRQSLSDFPAWARGKQGRVEPPAEAAASEDACVVKSTLSFEEMKAAHADRLKSIKVLSLLTEAAVEKIMAEVKAMRPKPEPGFVNESALIVQTCRGNLFRGRPWGKEKKALAWSLTIDVSDDSGTKDLVVYKGDWREVYAVLHIKSSRPSLICLRFIGAGDDHKVLSF